MKNYISLMLLFAVCWSFDAEAIIGMSASKALSYSNVVSGASSTSSSSRTISNEEIEKEGLMNLKVTSKKEEEKPMTHVVTMSNQNTATVETKFQVLKANDFLKVILPPFTWAVDMGTCEGIKNVKNNKISFQITGTTDSEKTCQIKFYGYNQDTAQLLNKVLNLTVE